MAIFKVLEFEEAVQVSDKTRLSAIKSYVSKGTSAITAVTIKPGADATALSVFATAQNDWFLDWQYDSFAFDIDSTNNKIDFSEDGSLLVATLTSGTYTESTLLAEIETQLEAAGAFDYTVTIDIENKIHIEADGNFELLPVSGLNKNNQILKHIGFSEDTGDGIAHISSPLEYGIRKITLSITSGTGLPAVTETKDFYQKVYSEAGDYLFCSDSDLKVHEKDILKWVVQGRNSYKDVYRRVQSLILEFLDEKGYADVNGKPFTKWSFLDLTEVKDWATYMSLKLIFEDLSNAADDVFDKKAKKYAKKETEARSRYLKIDIDGDGVIDEDEFARLQTGNLYFR